MGRNQELEKFIQNQKVNNTHSHQGDEKFFADCTYNLDAILKNSYVNWCWEDFGNSSESRRQYLDKVRYRNSFRSLEKSLNFLYDLPERITEENWDMFNQIIENSNTVFNSFEKLINISKYENIILDCYWNPGSNHNRSDLFRPTFRINIFLNGYNPDFVDQDGNNIRKYIYTKIENIDCYIEKIKSIIKENKENGCVALKCASAYERGLDFESVSKEDAQRALDLSPQELTTKDIENFQNYVFYKLCEIAACEDLPFQIHTGLGKLEKSNALQLRSVIADNPKTKFVLFHVSVHWVDDVLALSHNFTNVYLDLCWVSILSPTITMQIVRELLEMANIDRICWGCDTWTFEESFGAVQQFKENLLNVLNDKMENGYYSLEDSKTIIEAILYKNAKKLYKL